MSSIKYVSMVFIFILALLGAAYGQMGFGLGNLGTTSTPPQATQIFLLGADGKNLTGADGFFLLAHS